MKHIFALATAAMLGLGAPAMAESWTLDGDGSRLAFGSIKKDTVGEVHSFGGLSGTVAADGTAQIDIDLSSVETNIDIRNERMTEHVFKGVTTASLKAAIDMDDVKGLTVGGNTTTYADITLSFLGTDVDLEAELFVARLSETQVMVTTNDMIFLSTADIGVDAGVDTLMELAKLPGITRTTPITVRFLFNLDDQKAEAAPAASPATAVLVQAALAGDAKKGRRVFNKCRACHMLDEGKNGAGPSLHGIFGATAGQVDGFNYSDALASSGIVWTAETLAAFVANPKDVVPGNKMSFRGLKKEDEILDLLTYLQEETAG